MPTNNDPLFQSGKQFLKTQSQPPAQTAGMPFGEAPEPSADGINYASVADVKGPSSLKAQQIIDLNDEQLMEAIKAPLSGEEVAMKMSAIQSYGGKVDASTISKDEFIAFDAWREKQHFNFMGAVAEGALTAVKDIGKGVYSAGTDWKKLGLAVGLSAVSTPVVGFGVAYGSSILEGAARGTRDLGGLAVMAANHPGSPLYRMFVNPTNDMDKKYEDFLDLAKWNSQSEDILSGKSNALMPDREIYEKLFGKAFGDNIDDFIGVNKELATATSYFLDPTTLLMFAPSNLTQKVFGKAASAAIKSGQAGNTLGHAMTARAARNAFKASWLNSLGENMVKFSEATTRPIDAMFDSITKNAEAVTGAKTSISHNGTVRVARTAAGHGGARAPTSIVHSGMGALGIYSLFHIPYALPITSVYAGLKGVGMLGETILDVGKRGIQNSSSTIGKALKASLPVTMYMQDLGKTMVHGGMYGGLIGYAASGEEGAAGGIGTGSALGALGHGIGHAYGTFSGQFAREALYKEFDTHFNDLKDKGHLLKHDRVREFIQRISDDHGEEEALRAISHVMALEKSKNTAVAYMGYKDFLGALANDPKMWESVVGENGPERKLSPTGEMLHAALSGVVEMDKKTGSVVLDENGNPTFLGRRERVESVRADKDFVGPMPEQEGGMWNQGQGAWNGLFLDRQGKPSPIAIFTDGETGKNHIIINTDMLTVARDRYGNPLYETAFIEGRRTAMETSQDIRTTEEGPRQRIQELPEGVDEYGIPLKSKKERTVAVPDPSFIGPMPAKGVTRKSAGTIGPMPAVEVITGKKMVQAKTAPLGELWHAMNNAYRRINHGQEITNAVSDWLIGSGGRAGRAFSDRKQTVQFMHQVYRAIGGLTRDEGYNGAWMKAIDEFEQTGEVKSPEVQRAFRDFIEELGEAMFIGWESGKPFDYVYRGGDLGFARNLVESVKDSFFNRSHREATNLGADIRSREYFINWFKEAKDGRKFRMDPILEGAFNDLIRCYRDNEMKDAGRGRTNLTTLNSAQLKRQAETYGFEDRIEVDSKGEYKLKSTEKYNAEKFQLAQALTMEIAESFRTDPELFNGVDLQIVTDGRMDDASISARFGALDANSLDPNTATTDTLYKRDGAFLFQNQDFGDVGIGIDDMLRAQAEKTYNSGIYAPVKGGFGKRGRPRTTPTGKLHADLVEAMKSGKKLIISGIPNEKLFAIIQKYVPKQVSDNIRVMAPIIIDGGLSADNVVKGTYLGFEQTDKDGVTRNRKLGEDFNAREVNFVPYNLELSWTLDNIKNPQVNYSRPHLTYNVQGFDVDALNRRMHILWNQSEELRGLYGNVQQFIDQTYRTIDEYSGGREIPAVEFFGDGEVARQRRKHVVAAIGASPNKQARATFSIAEAEWHAYQNHDRSAEQNHPWHRLRLDGLSNLKTIDGERARVRMNEVSYYRSMVPTPIEGDGPMWVDSAGKPVMYQTPDGLTPNLMYDTIGEEKASLERDIQRLGEKIALQDKFGRRGNNPSYSWLQDRRRTAQNRLNEIDKALSSKVGEQGNALMQPADSSGVPRMSPQKLGRRYDMNSEKWNSGFIGRAAEENPTWVDKGTPVGKIETLKDKMIEFKPAKGHITLSILTKKGDEIAFVYAEPSADGKRLKKVSVNTSKHWRRRGYGDIAYSELIERARALDFKAFDGEIINAQALPMRMREKRFGVGGSFIVGPDWETIIDVATQAEVVRRLDNSIDLGSDHEGVRVSSPIIPSAFYQTAEIGDGPIPINKETLRDFHQSTSDKPYNADMLAKRLNDPMKALSELDKLNMFKKSKVKPMFQPADTFGAKSQDEADFLKSNYKWANEEAKDIFQSESLKRFVNQFKTANDEPTIIKWSLEEWKRVHGDVDAYNSQFVTGKPVVVIGTHGTPSAEVVKTMKFSGAKLGSNTGAKTSLQGTFHAGTQNTSGSYGVIETGLSKFIEQVQNASIAFDKNGNTSSREMVSAFGALKSFLFENMKMDDRMKQEIDFRSKQFNQAVEYLSGDSAMPNDVSVSKDEYGRIMREWIGSYERKLSSLANDFKFEFDEKNRQQVRSAIGFKNPFVVDMNNSVWAQKSEMIEMATKQGHDGVIVLNTHDRLFGTYGEVAADNLYIVLSGNEAKNIAVIDTNLTGKAKNRGINGNEGGRWLQQPSDDVLPAGAFGPNNPDTVKLSRAFKAIRGLSTGDGRFVIKLNRDKSFKIGMEYERMKHDPYNPKVRAAYKAFADETLVQMQHIIDAGYVAEMHVQKTEPYRGSSEAIADIRTNKRLKVLATDLNFGTRTVTAKDITENPLLAMSKFKDVNGVPMRINDVFRFVHDFFGHSERGNGFGQLGEENAWDVHARMYSPVARRAMTAGTRGQNSWVNFVNEPNIEINRKREMVRGLIREGRVAEAMEIQKTIGQTTFAEQKIGLMPEWTSRLDEELTPIEKQVYGTHTVSQNTFGLYQSPDGEAHSIHSPEPEEFSRIGRESQMASKFGTAVEIKNADGYRGYQLLMSGEGRAQASISPEGELGSVIKGVNGTAQDVEAVVRAALSTGKVRWLNAFDTVLPSMYDKFGFEAVARLAFVDEYRPDGWDYVKYAKFNSGRPDVVFMAYVGEGKAVPYDRNKARIPMVSSYDDAVTLTQTRAEAAKQDGYLMQPADNGPDPLTFAQLTKETQSEFAWRDLIFEYAEFARMTEEKVKASSESMNKNMLLASWFNKNRHKFNGVSQSPLSWSYAIGAKGERIPILEFTKEKLNELKTEIAEKDPNFKKALREREAVMSELYTTEADRLADELRAQLEEEGRQFERQINAGETGLERGKRLIRERYRAKALAALGSKGKGGITSLKSITDKNKKAESSLLAQKKEQERVAQRKSKLRDIVELEFMKENEDAEKAGISREDEGYPHPDLKEAVEYEVDARFSEEEEGASKLFAELKETEGETDIDPESVEGLSKEEYEKLAKARAERLGNSQQRLSGEVFLYHDENTGVVKADKILDFEPMTAEQIETLMRQENEDSFEKDGYRLWSEQDGEFDKELQKRIRMNDQLAEIKKQVLASGYVERPINPNTGTVYRANSLDYLAKYKHANSIWFNDKGDSILREIRDGNTVTVVKGVVDGKPNTPITIEVAGKEPVVTTFKDLPADIKNKLLNEDKPDSGVKTIYPDDYQAVIDKQQEALDRLKRLDTRLATPLEHMMPLFGLFSLWGFEVNKELISPDFQAGFTEGAIPMNASGAETLRAALSQSGVLFTGFDREARFTQALKDLPDLMTTTVAVLSELTEGAYFSMRDRTGKKDKRGNPAIAVSDIKLEKGKRPVIDPNTFEPLGEVDAENPLVQEWLNSYLSAYPENKHLIATISTADSVTPLSDKELTAKVDSKYKGKGMAKQKWAKEHGRNPNPEEAKAIREKLKKQIISEHNMIQLSGVPQFVGSFLDDSAGKRNVNYGDRPSVEYRIYLELKKQNDAQIAKKGGKGFGEEALKQAAKQEAKDIRYQFIEFLFDKMNEHVLEQAEIFEESQGLVQKDWKKIQEERRGKANYRADERSKAVADAFEGETPETFSTAEEPTGLEATSTGRAMTPAEEVSTATREFTTEEVGTTKEAEVQVNRTWREQSDKKGTFTDSEGKGKIVKLADGLGIKKDESLYGVYIGDRLIGRETDMKKAQQMFETQLAKFEADGGIANEAQAEVATAQPVQATPVAETTAKPSLGEGYLAMMRILEGEDMGEVNAVLAGKKDVPATPAKETKPVAKPVEPKPTAEAPKSKLSNNLQGLTTAKYFLTEQGSLGMIEKEGPTWFLNSKHDGMQLAERLRKRWAMISEEGKKIAVERINRTLKEVADRTVRQKEWMKEPSQRKKDAELALRLIQEHPDGTSLTNAEFAEVEKTEKYKKIRKEYDEAVEAYNEAYSKRGNPFDDVIDIIGKEIDEEPEVSATTPASPAPYKQNTTATPLPFAGYDTPIGPERPPLALPAPKYGAYDAPIGPRRPAGRPRNEPKPVANPNTPKEVKKTEVATQQAQKDRQTAIDTTRVNSPNVVGASQIVLETQGPIAASSSDNLAHVQAVLSIKDHLTLKMSGNRISSTDKRYIVTGKAGKYEVVMQAHASPYTGQILDQRRVAIVPTLEHAQLCIREFDNLHRRLAEAEGVNTSANLQASAPVMAPQQIAQVANQVAQANAQNPVPPVTSPRTPAEVHPHFNACVVGLSKLRIQPALAKELVTNAVMALGNKATVQEIVTHALSANQVLASQIASANQIFVATVNQSTSQPNPSGIQQVVIIPSLAGLNAAVNAVVPKPPVMNGGLGYPTGFVAGPTQNQIKPKWAPLPQQLQALNQLIRFNYYQNFINLPNGQTGVGVTLVNPLGYTIMQTSPSKFRVFAPNKMLISVADNEQQACDDLAKHYFKR